MLLKKIGVIGFILILFASTPLTVSASSAAADEIARELICQCGCYAVLNNCTHGECMVRDGMLKAIEQQLIQGRSKEQIIGTFIGQYGEQVLSSPPKKGFNLTAWIAPFAAIIIGGLVIWLALKKWVRRGKQSSPETVIDVDAGKTDDEKYRLELEKDLKEFEERGFR